MKQPCEIRFSLLFQFIFEETEAQDGLWLSHSTCCRIFKSRSTHSKSVLPLLPCFISEREVGFGNECSASRVKMVFLLVEHWSQPPVQGLCCFFRRTLGNMRRVRKQEWRGAWGLIPKIAKRIRILMSGERRIQREIADISTCFMGYLLEELDLFFVVSGGRSRITW